MINENSGIPMGHDVIGPKYEKDNSTYSPSADEEKDIKMVEDLYSKAKNARKPYDDKWMDYYRMFRGRQWKEQRPSYRHSEVINLIFRAIQSEVPILTDSRPKPEFIPQEPGDLELAEIMNNIFDSDWNEGGWLYQLTEVIYDAHFYGAGFASVTYDPDAACGAGRIKFQSEDTFYVYPDPSARDVNKSSNYFIFAEPIAIDKLKQEYPNFAQYIKPDIIDITKRDRANFSEQVRYKSPTDNRTVINGTSAYDLEAKDEALKIQCWIHDESYIEEELNETDENGMPKVSYVQKLKHPQGRHLTVASGVLVDDSPIPYEDKSFPYIKLINYMLPREFWGISEIEQLESPQKIFNKLISFALDVLTLMGNPIWIVDSSSQVDAENLFNRPGLIVEKAPGSEVRREEGVHLQPYVLQMIDRMKLWFDDVSGSSDSSRGVRPEGVTAASAIEALQEASQTRLRQKTRYIDDFMQQMGKMYLSRVFQYYDAPRVFRVTGQGNVLKYFKFHVEREPVMDEMGNQVDEKRVAKVRTYDLGVDGEYYLSEEKRYEMQSEFDVRVSSGSSLPFEKNRIESQSYALYDRGIIDAEEVLKNIKYPNAEAVMKRKMEKEALAAQQGAMQGQPPA